MSSVAGTWAITSLNASSKISTAFQSTSRPVKAKRVPSGLKTTARTKLSSGREIEASGEDGLAARLMSAIQAVAAAPGICYAAASYPYFFKDTDGDKSCSTTETVATNGFSAWTPALVKATYNYQLSRKDPGAWAHNFDYTVQLLYDGIADLGGNVTGLRRP